MTAHPAITIARRLINGKSIDPKSPHAWLKEFDAEDLLTFLDDMANSTDPLATLDEWHESALVCASGVLDEFLPFLD